MYLCDTPLKYADDEKSYLSPPPYHIFFLLGWGRRNTIWTYQNKLEVRQIRITKGKVFWGDRTKPMKCRGASQKYASPLSQGWRDDLNSEALFYHIKLRSKLSLNNTAEHLTTYKPNIFSIPSITWLILITDHVISLHQVMKTKIRSFMKFQM